MAFVDLDIAHIEVREDVGRAEGFEEPPELDGDKVPVEFDRPDLVAEDHTLEDSPVDRAGPVDRDLLVDRKVVK